MLQNAHTLRWRTTEVEVGRPTSDVGTCYHNMPIDRPVVRASHG
jgi:hypothetical protein